MWKAHEVRDQLEQLKDKFSFRLPQMQSLLCQEWIVPEKRTVVSYHFSYSSGLLLSRAE